MKTTAEQRAETLKLALKDDYARLLIEDLHETLFQLAQAVSGRDAAVKEADEFRAQSKTFPVALRVQLAALTADRDRLQEKLDEAKDAIREYVNEVTALKMNRRELLDMCEQSQGRERQVLADRDRLARECERMREALSRISIGIHGRRQEKATDAGLCDWEIAIAALRTQP
jgi:chromosome segregation ATPase